MNNTNNAKELEIDIPIIVDESELNKSENPNDSSEHILSIVKDIEPDESGKSEVLWENDGVHNLKDSNREETHSNGEVKSISENQRSQIHNVINEQIGETGTSVLLTGENANDLADGMMSFDLPNKTHITASTDIGINKKENQDRVMINKKYGVTAVIDGVGGEKDGGIFAQVLSEELGTSPLAPLKAVDNAILKAKELGLDKDAAACFMSARLHREPGSEMCFTDIMQAGDVKMIILDESGNVHWSSRDQSLVDLIASGNLTYEQLAMQIPRNNPIMKVMKARSESGHALLSEDEATYSTLRNQVVNYVGGGNEVNIKRHKDIPVKRGYRMIMTTDGVSDNLTNEEIADLVRGKSAEEGMKIISETTNERMINGKMIVADTMKYGGRANLGEFTDGFKSLPKASGDNRGVVIEDIL